MTEEETKNMTITDKNMPYITYRKKYRKVKIEKMGEDALKLVLDGVKRGRSYRQIATILSESYDKKVTHKDVIAVLDSNSEIMVQYQKFLIDHNHARANMVLEESTVLTVDMERLELASRELEDRMNRAIATKDMVEITKAMADLVRTRSSIITTYKKLTGQYKEGPRVLIDQSKKQLNIQATPETASKLAKELARAEFKSNTKPEEIKEDKPKKVIDVEVTKEDEENQSDISLCRHCNCMTKTTNGTCGKCSIVK